MELLTPAQMTNEYIMTSLRTMEGLNLDNINNDYKNIIENASLKFIERGLMRREVSILILTKEGKLLADGIASELFVE